MPSHFGLKEGMANIVLQNANILAQKMEK